MRPGEKKNLNPGLVRSIEKNRFAPVAQLDRAPDYESVGREFESLQARQ